MDVDRLRAETRAQHEAVEALLPLTSPDLTREMYGDVLVCMYSVVHSWEEWAFTHAPDTLTELVQQRRRSPLLLTDLQFLHKEGALESRNSAGEKPDANFPDTTLKGSDFEAAFLGAMYVMEGSTLGGQYIARHVEERFGFEPGHGNAYFRGYGQQTGTMWRTFQGILKQLPETATHHVIQGAKAMFTHFDHRMRNCPGISVHSS